MGKKMKIVLALLGLFALVSCATMSDSGLTPELARVVEIIEVPGLDKFRLFVLANSWAVDAFVSAESVIEFSDKEAGIVKGKYVTSFMEGVYSYDVRSTLTIEVKDGAARITIADPYYRTTSGLGKTYTGQSYYPLKSLSSFEKNCKPNYLELIVSFKTALKDTSGVF